MSSKTNYLEAQLLNHVLRNVAYSSPTTIYVALFTIAPGEAGGGTEVTGGSYVRQSVTFTAPAPDTCSNDADVLFPAATANWGTIVSFALFDQSSGGNMLYYASLSAPRTVETTDTFRFAESTLQVVES